MPFRTVVTFAMPGLLCVNSYRLADTLVLGTIDITSASGNFLHSLCITICSYVQHDCYWIYRCVCIVICVTRDSFIIFVFLIGLVTVTVVGVNRFRYKHIIKCFINLSIRSDMCVDKVSYFKFTGTTSNGNVSPLLFVSGLEHAVIDTLPFLLLC